MNEMFWFAFAMPFVLGVCLCVIRWFALRFKNEDTYTMMASFGVLFVLLSISIYSGFPEWLTVIVVMMWGATLVIGTENKISDRLVKQ